MDMLKFLCSPSGDVLRWGLGNGEQAVAEIEAIAV